MHGKTSKNRDADFNAEFTAAVTIRIPVQGAGWQQNVQMVVSKREQHRPEKRVGESSEDKMVLF